MRGNARRKSSALLPEHPLRTLRRKLGWTQPKLAKRARLSVQTIVAIERWKNHPSRDTRRRLLNAVRLPYTEHVNLFPPIGTSPKHTLEDRAWAQLIASLEHAQDALNAKPITDLFTILKSLALAKREHRPQDEVVGLLEALTSKVNAVKRSAA